MFTACDDDNPTYIAPAKLDIKSADAMFEAIGGTGTIVVNTAEEITASVDVDWLTTSVSDNIVTITAASNYNLEGRSGNVILKTISATSKVNVSQKGSVYYIDLDDGRLQIADSANSSIVIPVTHTHDVIVESLTSWLTATFDKENSQIVIVGADNSSVNPRTGRVAFSTGVIKDTLYITQQGMQFRLEKEAVVSANEGGDFSIALSATKSVSVESSADWVVAVYDEEAGALKLTIAANPTGTPRSAEITIVSGQSELTLVVNQYDFAKELYGDYVFVYYDTNFETATMDATLTSKGLAVYYPATETIVLPYTIPVKVNEEEGTIAFGPNGSFLGMYGSSYYIYLLLTELTETGNLVYADFSDQSMVEGTLSFEEEDEDGVSVTTTYLDFSGTFGNGNEISIWTLGACDAKVFSEDSYQGPLDFIIYPYMVKVSAGGSSEASGMRRILSKKKAKAKQNWQLPVLMK